MTALVDEIFYIDDSPDDIFLVNYQVRGGGFAFTVKTFITGIAAIVDLERRVATGEPLPRLIVVDFYMPITDGPEFLRLIRANPQFDSISLGICTGSDDPHDRQLAEDAGASFLLEKPLSLAICQKLLDAGATTDMAVKE